MPIGEHLFLFPQASALPSSDDSTLSSFTDLLLHACVIGSDEPSSLCTPPHAPLQMGMWPSLAYTLDLVIGPYGEQDTHVGSSESFQEMQGAGGIGESPFLSL